MRGEVGTVYKQKLLILRDIFLEFSDEDHPLTVPDLIKLLRERGVSAERKTLYDDISVLIENGLDIIVEKQGHYNAYYVGTRLFQDEELAVLSDAVASSKFLTVRKSNELLKKIQKLTSKYKAPSLKRSVFIANRSKTFNERIYYTINEIQNAIQSSKKLSFKYYEYTVEKKKELKHGGAVYIVSPFELVWENDNYYLICFCEKHNGVSRYRVDRMSDVKKLDDKSKELSISEESIAKSLRSTYNMYGGKNEDVTFLFKNSLMNVIIDRYGDKFVAKRVTEDRFSVTLEVQISPTFFGWLFQFGTDAEILGPEWVKNEVKNRLDEIRNIYKD